MTDRADTVGPPTLGGKTKRAAWRVGVPVVAVVGGLVGGGVVLSWGLVAPFLIVWPLTLGSCALVSALGASWVGTLLAPDLTRSRLPRVVVASEVAAVVLAVTFLLIPLPPGFLLLASTVIVGLVTSWATWRFRGPAGRMGWGVAAVVLAVAVLALGLLGLNGSLSGVLSVPVGTAAVVLGVVLFRGRFGGAGRPLGGDAAVTLGLAGLPAPVFFGAYYAAFLLGMTSG